MELELNEIANFGLDLCGFEDWLSILAQGLDDVNLDLVGLGRNEGGKGCESKDGLREEHFDFGIFLFVYLRGVKIVDGRMRMAI